MAARRQRQAEAACGGAGETRACTGARTARWRSAIATPMVVSGGARCSGGITAARAQLRAAQAARDNGERESADPRLRFGEAADRWLAEQVVELRPSTRANYAGAVKHHLRPHWGNRRMDSIDVTDAARLVRELRAAGVRRVDDHGDRAGGEPGVQVRRRHCRWRGENSYFGERSPNQAPHPSGGSTARTSWRRRSRRRRSRGRRCSGSRASRRAARASCSGSGDRTSGSPTSMPPRSASRTRSTIRESASS